MTGLPSLLTAPAQALVWAEPPLAAPASGPGDDPLVRRARAFAEAWACRGGPRLAATSELRTLTWLGAGGLSAGRRQEMLGSLAALPGQPRVVVELAARELVAGDSLEWLVVPTRSAGAAGAAPPWLQLLLVEGEQPPECSLELAGQAVQAGLPVAADIVLGAHAAPGRLRELCLALAARQIRPQSLLLGDWLPATARIGEAAALERVGTLRGWISGVAAPQLVREDGAGRRRAIVPERVESTVGTEVTVRNYRGRRYAYRDPAEPER